MSQQVVHKLLKAMEEICDEEKPPANMWYYGSIHCQLWCCGVVGHLMLLDCQSLEVMQIPIKELDEHPIFLITNSNMEHAIANGEYCMVSDDVNVAKQ
jgi:galactokinase